MVIAVAIIKQVHKTQLFETKLDVLKRTDNGEERGEVVRSLGLSRSTVSTNVENRVKVIEHMKISESLKSIMMNPKRSVMTRNGTLAQNLAV
jgi:transcriptional regulator